MTRLMQVRMRGQRPINHGLLRDPDRPLGQGRGGHHAVCANGGQEKGSFVSGVHQLVPSGAAANGCTSAEPTLRQAWRDRQYRRDDIA